MDRLEMFLNSIERIANSLEILTKEKVQDTPIVQASTPVTQPTPGVMAQPPITSPIPVNTPPIQNIPQPVMQQAPVNTQMPIGIPTTGQVEIFSQDQIALAMSNAIGAGKNELVHTILRTFNANSLMEIDQSNYNQIATMLREAGIQI